MPGKEVRHFKVTMKSFWISSRINRQLTLSNSLIIFNNYTFLKNNSINSFVE